MRLPSVDRVLLAAPGLIAEHGRSLVLDAVRAALAERRAAGKDAEIAEIIAAAQTALADLTAKSQRRVFNLTGTVLHTNLGRAPLPEEAIEAAAEAMRSPTSLEYELDSGKRGERDDHIAGWLTRLTGAEAALAVNNNAGALVLALNALAAGRETIVSRGELIEIGGAFRLPDIMARAGTTLREVGTTNRTHLRDFAAAIGPNTGLILKVHTSNYEIQGFTAAAPAPRLAELAREHKIPLVEDLGSGTLVGLERWGLPHEPTIAEALKAGADLVTFSGDKLLGGPQAGILAGRREALDRIRRHPLMRALRVDKLTYAALEATLEEYAAGRGNTGVPVQRMLALTVTEIGRRAEALAAGLSRSGWRATVIDGSSTVGGGSAPGASLPTRLVRLERDGVGADQLEAGLRALDPPVIARIEHDHVVIDLRTVAPEDDEALAQAMRLL